MHHKGRFPNVFFGANLRPDSAALAIMVLLLFLIFVLLFMTLTAQPAQEQTYKVIYSFTGGADGRSPGGLTMDAAGNLYGAACGGGSREGDCYSIGCCGVVFKLSPKTSGWVLTPLYTFLGLNNGDGKAPTEMSVAPNRGLLGTTRWGGTGECIYLKELWSQRLHNRLWYDFQPETSPYCL
jgi:hypothetical protein